VLNFKYFLTIKHNFAAICSVYPISHSLSQKQHLHNFEDSKLNNSGFCSIKLFRFAYLWGLRAVASPGFVAIRGKDGNYVVGHSRWTSGPGTAAAR